MKRIYLDGNAGARLRASVGEVLPLLMQARNPSSVHHDGRSARALLRTARRQVLRLLGLPETGKSHRLIFTSGGTEACNLIVRGFLGENAAVVKCPGHIVSTAIEHPAVLEPLAELRSLGWAVDLVPPGHDGIISPEIFLAAVRSETALVCLMAANNETGAIQPVESIARALRAKGYHGAIVCDFVQALGKGQVSADALFTAGVDALAISAHKIGAPAGSGAVIFGNLDAAVCRSFLPLQRGGFQEEGFRPGTENLFGALAFGAVAAELSAEEMSLSVRHCGLRDLLWEELCTLEGAIRLGPADSRQVLGNTLMVRFAGCRGDDLIVALDVAGVMASTGSACASGKQGVSPVVQSMGLTADEAREAVRFSLDWASSEEEIREAALRIRETIFRARTSGLPAQAGAEATQRQNGGLVA